VIEINELVRDNI